MVPKCLLILLFFFSPVSGLPARMFLSAHVLDSLSSSGVNTTAPKRLFHQEIASDGPVIPFGEASRRRNIKSKAAFRISEENFHDRFGDTTVNKLAGRTSMRSLSRRIPSRPLNQTSRRCPSRRPAGLDCPVIRRPRSTVLQCVSATFFRFSTPTSFSFLPGVLSCVHSFPRKSPSRPIRVRKHAAPKITNSLTHKRTNRR